MHSRLPECSWPCSFGYLYPELLLVSGQEFALVYAVRDHDDTATADEGRSSSKDNADDTVCDSIFCIFCFTFLSNLFCQEVLRKRR